MQKCAAIYVRVSSERQAVKVSPQEQEKACLAHCETHGYYVTAIFRDTEKYRVGRRMVETSGTRADRPQLQKMLAEINAGRVDIVVAWREDRLYRGLRPMLEVIDCIERNRITVDLVTETFDSKMAPIKAAIARMELEAIKERMMLGMAGRLAAGKSSPGILAYGYQSDQGFPIIQPVEAGWVLKMYEWYADGVGLNEIRRRLIASDAPQRQHSTYGRGKLPVKWANQIIQRSLRYSPYWLGEQEVKIANGQTFTITLPVIIPPELAERANERRNKNKGNHNRNVKHPFLVSGYAYCATCGVKLQAKSRMRTRSHTPGGEKHLEMTYSCKYHDIGYQTGGTACCKTISATKLDAAVWAKVRAVVMDDELFEFHVRRKVDDLRQQEADAQAAADRLESALDDIAIERQKIITWARRGAITEVDMELQLGGMKIQETAYQRELEEKRMLLGGEADRMIALANRYRAALRYGAEFFDDVPATPEEAAEQFKLKRELLDAIVTRIDVQTDKTPLVTFSLDLAQAVDAPAGAVIPIPSC